MEKNQMTWPLEEHEKLFHSGQNSRAWEFMGAHPCEQDGQTGYFFRVFAPNAVEVGVMGEFNNWDRTSNMMHRDDWGMWTAFIPGVKQYDAYKYA